MICLILGMGFVAGISIGWNKAVGTYESYFQPAPGAPPLPEIHGRIFLDHDAYHWISYAREMARTGAWRIRHTKIDNAPFGRPVHWSQSISWLLVGAGWLRHRLTGEPMDAAIEAGALWIGPVQLVVLIGIVGLLIYRRMGAVPSGIWMLSMAAMGNIYWIFQTLKPDHHGLQLGFVLGSLVSLIFGGLGWVNVTASRERKELRDSGAAAHGAGLQVEPWFIPLELPGMKSARCSFAASGVLGGLGLWTGATVQLVGIGVIAMSALLLVIFMPSEVRDRKGETVSYQPGLWRLWALTGAVTSLALYLVEYFPAHMEMRLEANHPLYALAWLCTGEILMLFSGWKLKVWPFRRADIVRLLLFSAGATVLPVLLVAGPSDWHYLRTPLCWRISQFIVEGWSLTKFAGERTIPLLIAGMGVLPVFLLAAPWLASSGRTSLYEWAVLWMSFVPAFVYLIAGFMQIRWMSLYSGMITWLMVPVLTVLWRNSTRQGWPKTLLKPVMAILIVQAIALGCLQVDELRQISRGRTLRNDLVTRILERYFVIGLAALNTDGKMRVLTEMDFAVPLYYFSGIPGIASYYWENRD
ncbi:MAG: hypothetical protein KKC51_08060, partial [Verrucomicrobia bacterium]|nr:hypothetical protein [Verrucomicrobiota bacterium]